MRPVVVTGIGVVSPLGLNASANWKALMAGKGSGSPLSGPEWARIQNPKASVVADFQALPGLENRDRSIQLAVLAAAEAWNQAKLQKADTDRIGTTFSSSKGGMLSLLKAGEVLIRDGKVSEDFLADFFPSTAGMVLKQQFGFRGPILSFSAACATGLGSIAQGADWIERGDCDIVLTGSGESALHPLMMAAFHNMGLLSRQEEGGSPFDLHRDGFVMGEGSGILVLEAESSARARAVPILARLKGWALGADGEGILEIDPQGHSIMEVIFQALGKAQLFPSAVRYVNAHGTGTRMNDVTESRALYQLFGDEETFVSSTKGATGHLLGAAGSVEAAYSVMALTQGEAPATRNLKNPDLECRIRHVEKGGMKQKWGNVLSLSYGIGGQLGAVIFSEYK